LWCLKAPFCDHRAIKLTQQNCVCFTNPCIKFCLPSLVNTTPSYLNVQLMELIHEHSLLLETYESIPPPTLRRQPRLDSGVEEFPLISHLLSIRTTALSRRDSSNIQGIFFDFLDQFVFFPCEWSDVPVSNHQLMASMPFICKALCAVPSRLPRCGAGSKWDLQLWVSGGGNIANFLNGWFCLKLEHSLSELNDPLCDVCDIWCAMVLIDFVHFILVTGQVISLMDKFADTLSKLPVVRIKE